MFVLEHNGFKVGDLITAYHKGYWRITRICRRFYTVDDPMWSRHDGKVVRHAGDEYSALIYYTLVMNSKGIKKNGVYEKCCDEGFCKKFDIETEKKVFEDRIKLLEELSK